MNFLSSVSRRSFLSACAGLGGFLAASGLRAKTYPPGSVSAGPHPQTDFTSMNAYLLSATTLPGGVMLAHALPWLAKAYQGCRRLLLVSYASVPEDREGYVLRMQNALSPLGENLRIVPAHRFSGRELHREVMEADSIYVSGGETFLLLRTLYDEDLLDLLAGRVASGVPYVGSSAGSNVAGLVIGTTNDFPVTDIPSRRAMGFFPALINPHHPEPENEAEFGGRGWKINNYCRINPAETVVGLTDPGILHLAGISIRLVSGRAYAYTVGQRDEYIAGGTDDLSFLRSVQAY